MTSTERKAKTIRYILEGTAVLVMAAIIAILIALHVTRPPIQYNQQIANLEETVQARILDVLEEESFTDENGLVMVTQKLDVEITPKARTRDSALPSPTTGWGRSWKPSASAPKNARW